MDSLFFTNLTNKYHDDIFRYRYRERVIFFMEYNEKIFGALKPNACFKEKSILISPPL